MKRLLLVLAAFGMCSAALFAQNINLSAGLGGNFTADFTSFALTKDGKDVAKAEDVNSHLVGGGFYLFFDATYVEANVGLLIGNSNGDKEDGMSYFDKGYDVTAIKLGLFGKYPIDLGSFTLFPMLGIDGQICVGGKIGGEEIPSDWQEDFNKMFSWFWIKLGVGADIPLAEKFYLRPEFLYGIRLNTEDEKDTIDQFNSGTKMLDGIVGHGLDVRVAVGYRF